MSNTEELRSSTALERSIAPTKRMQRAIKAVRTIEDPSAVCLVGETLYIGSEPPSTQQERDAAARIGAPRTREQEATLINLLRAVQDLALPAHEQIVQSKDGGLFPDLGITR